MEKIKEVLKPYGSFDVLYYYSKIAGKLEKFLAGREIATKTVLKNFFFLKRGSNSKPLFIKDLRCVNEKMLKLRAGHGLSEPNVRKLLTDKQILVWQYFVPRKPIHFFYATNGEKPGRAINRIFIDIDRQDCSSEDARKVALSLLGKIKKDKEFNKMFKFKIFLMWTGSSFHIYLLLNKKINPVLYKKYLSYGKKKEESFIMKWAFLVSKETGLKVKAGHEREKKAIVLDSSNTPSGKLARPPFSLHVSKKGEIDGVAVPLSENELKDKTLISKLKKLTPEIILRNLGRYNKLLSTKK